MLNKLVKFAALPTMIGLALGGFTIVTPAEAASPTSKPSAASTASFHENGIAPGATAKPNDIPWDKVLRVLGSMVECEALVPVYQAIYFPSVVYCVPNGKGAVLVVIELLSPPKATDPSTAPKN